MKSQQQVHHSQGQQNCSEYHCLEPLLFLHELHYHGLLHDCDHDLVDVLDYGHARGYVHAHGRAHYCVKDHVQDLDFHQA